jgi:hypothetical protein
MRVHYGFQFFIKGGHQIGKNWYVTKENLERFLDGPGQEVKGITES